MVEYTKETPVRKGLRHEDGKSVEIRQRVTSENIDDRGTGSFKQRCNWMKEGQREV